MPNHFSVKSKSTISRFKLDTRYVEYLNGVCINHVEESGVTYKRFDRIAFLDWDWPNVSHKANECVTIDTIDDVYRLLQPWLIAQPDQSIRIYETPGGIRGALTGKLQTVDQFVALGVDTLNADPMFIKLCIERKMFGARVSPKLNRSGDFIARYVCTLGCAEDPKVVEVIERFHDSYLIVS